MRQGFSLLELSIVLVIIGLITGGIMAGQSMVRAAELRSVVTDIRKYQSAVNTFRDKYQALPGDMKNATAYWGALADGGPSAACSTAAPSGTATCNGNGNGQVEDLNDSTYIQSENFRFWQHLANAGLVEGSYTGESSPAGGVIASPGVNVPASKISGAGYSVEAPCSGSATKCDNTSIDYGNIIEFGAGNASSYTYSNTISPADAYSIDSKIDDGFPTRGTVRQWVGYNSSFSGTGGNCSSGASFTDVAAMYTLTYSGIACSLEFLKAF